MAQAMSARQDCAPAAGAAIAKVCFGYLFIQNNNLQHAALSSSLVRTRAKISFIFNSATCAMDSAAACNVAVLERSNRNIQSFSIIR